MDSSTSSPWNRFSATKSVQKSGPRFSQANESDKMGSMATPGKLPTITYTDLDGEHCFPLAMESASIGRSPDQDLVLREAFVSRRHATHHAYEWLL